MANAEQSRIQREGKREAARRYDKSARDVVATSNVVTAAAAPAAPRNDAQAADTAAARHEGLSHSNGEVSGDRPPTPAGDTASERARLWEMIKDIRFAMFTARHANGHLHSRPMTTQNSKLDQDTSLWFYMSRSGQAVADLASDPVVNVAYADPDADRYVSISGTAAVVENPAKKRALWSKVAQAWFPGGATDPDLALVQVRIIHANYWDVKENKLVQLFHMAKAVITGQPPHELGEHAEIRMR